MFIFKVVTMLFLCASVTAQGDFEWSDQFIGGSNQTVFKMDGTFEGFVGARQSTAVEYINEMGDMECHILYEFSHATWRTFGDIGSINGGTACPLLNGSTPIRTLAAFGTDVCIGGDFTNLGGVTGLSYFACYSPTLNWYQPGGIGNGPNNAVYAMDSNGINVFLGGSFTTVNGGVTSAKHVVKTDGIFWEPLYTDAQQTDNGVSFTVQSILTTTNFLVVNMGKSTLTWNSSVPEWKVRGTHNGFNSAQNDVVNIGSTLVVATPGANTVSGDPGGSISEFNIGGEDWTEYGGTLGIDTDFAQLAMGLGPLYASGNFTSLDSDARGLAWYNGVSWMAAPMHEQLGDLNNFQVTEMEQGGNQFCLRTQGNPLDATKYWTNLVCYDGNNWIGENRAPISNVVQTIAAYQGKIVHGGDFNNIGDQKSAFVAAHDGQAWESISELAWTGSGQGHVSHLQVFDNELYATGTFNQANGVAVNGIAKYDGNHWVPVTNGLNAYNSLMTVWNGKLILNAFHNNLGPILSWDGSQIEEVGNFQISGTFSDLTTYQGDLVGSFFSSGTGRIYQFDGNSWQTTSGTMVGIPLTLESKGSDLYVAGNFTAACQGVDFINANNIYRFDGNNCHALGSGLVNNTNSNFEEVRDIVFYEDQVIVTGRFDQAGSVMTTSIASWVDGSWHDLGLGLRQGEDQGQGNTLWSDSINVYVSGFFEQAGDKLSHNFASVRMKPDDIYKNGFE